MCRSAAGAKYNMLNRLEAAGRLLIRISIALFTAVVLLVVQSVFWSNAVSRPVRAALFGVAILAFFRPQNALLVVAGLAPLAQVWVPLLGSRMRGGEAMVLAFLSGALLRGWTLGSFRAFPSDRLQTATALLGAVVAASCLEQLWFSQMQLDYPGPFLWNTATHLGRTYFTSSRSYVFQAMLLLEGLALLVGVAHYCRLAPAFASKVVRMMVISAVGAAAINLAFFAKELVETGAPLERFAGFVTGERWSAHVGDVNASGSIFAMGMFIAFGMALTTRPKRFAWAAAGLILGIVMWMTSSRTALVAALLVTFVSAAVAVLRRFYSARTTLAALAATLVVLSAAIWQLVPLDSLGQSASRAITIRWLFLGTTWRMLLSEPLFGVGIGQYALWSYDFAAPEMLNYYARENAHNNFAQVAGELGLVGLVAFLMVLATAFWRGRHLETSSHSAFMPLMLGLAAFILTWLGGHPLLIPEVSYPFWIALGIVAGLASTVRPVSRSAGLVAVVFLALLISILPRVERKTDRLDLSTVRFGFSEQQLVSSHGRLFIQGDRLQAALPLRAWGVSHDSPLDVDLFVNEHLTRSFTIADSEWRSERIELPQNGTRRFYQIDLLIKPPAILEDVDSRSRRGLQVGDWEIMPKPNG